jgi:hypothetical protein
VDDGLLERLDAWQRAGIVDAATVEAITEFEREVATAPKRPPVATERISPAEGLTYLGVAVVLAGVLYGVLSGLGSRASGPVVLVLAAGAAAAGISLRRDGTAGGRRSAGAALSAAAGLAALGIGQLLIAADAFTQTHASTFYPGPFHPGGGSATAGVTIVQTERNEAALAAISSALALLLGLAALAAVAVPFTALLVSAAAYVTSISSAWAIAGAPGLRVGVAPLIAAACLLVLSAADIGRAAATPLRFAAAIVPPPALLVLGTIEGAPTWPLIVVAALVALAAMRAAVQLSSNALALAAGIGVFGVSLDVAFRTLGGGGGAPVVLVVTGLLLLLSAVLTQQAMKTNRSRTVVRRG